MAKKRKPKYYAAQVGGNFNWSIPENNSPSVVNQTATGALDIYGNQYFKQDNTGTPTTNNPDIVAPTQKQSIWSFLGNTNKTQLNPAIQSLNAGMQTVTGVANMINEVKNRKNEKEQMLRNITPDYYENMEGYGLNANPVFTQYGGKASKYQTGGDTYKQGKTGPNDPIDDLILYKPKDSVKQIRFEDKRSSSPTTGKAFKEKGAKSLNAPVPSLKAIIAHAKAQGVDPYDALAIAYQESNFGAAGGGFGEVKDFFPDENVGLSFNEIDERKLNEDANVLAKALKEKNAYAKSLGFDKKGDAFRLQSYNGYGKLKPQKGEKTTAFYGIPVSADNPLNMAQNPAYGKTVASLRDQILKGNKELAQLITDTPAFAPNVVGMQTGGIVNEASYKINAQLAYYKSLLNNKLKEKNPQAFNDYVKEVQNLRVKGGIKGADDFIQNSNYNEYLTPDEVRKTLGETDYTIYDAYLRAAKPKLAGEAEDADLDYGNLNYGRRFAALPFTTSYSNTGSKSGKSYSRSFTYNPKTALTEWTETGDISMRPDNFAKQQEKQMTQSEANQMMADLRKSSTLPSKQMGGSIPKTYGLQQGGQALANVEAERGEAFQTDDGQIAQVANDANTHDQGGVFLPNVHRVLENTSNLRKDKASKALKLDAADVKHATGADVKGTMSHAEALTKANDFFEKKRNQITKKIELGARDRQELDKYGDLSTKLNVEQFAALPTKEQLFEQLFNNQEMVKMMNGIPTGGTTSKYGGLSRDEDYGSKSKPYPSVSSGDFAGGDRSYPIPTKADAIDALRLAGLHGRDDVKAKVYAKYPDLKKQYGGTTKMQLAGYAGNKSGQKTPAGNSDAFPERKDFKFQDYLNDLTGKGFKYEGITSPADFQLALYDYNLQNNPDDIKRMWGEGIHNKGRAEALKLGLVDSKGMFKPGVLDDPKNLEKLKSLYADGILGVRTMNLAGKKTPPKIYWPDDTPQAEVPKVEQDLDTGIVPPNIVQQPRSGFYEPLRWYDVASPVNAYMAALEREPTQFNPMEFNQLRYKLQDPTAALQQNQADFNAAVQATQAAAPNNPGAAAANVANLAASKYAANNQVLGQYENQNAQIKNNEITYNTQVRDKNSLADQQAREVFENKVLQSRAIQQEQKLTALDSLYKTIAENRALNRNGNLVMKFSRAFDQYGEYNGYQPQFTVNPAFGINNSPYEISPKTGAAGAAGGIQQLGSGKSYYNRKTGKTLYFDGKKLVERK